MLRIQVSPREIEYSVNARGRWSPELICAVIVKTGDKGSEDELTTLYRDKRKKDDKSIFEPNPVVFPVPPWLLLADLPLPTKPTTRLKNVSRVLTQSRSRLRLNLV